MAIPAKIDRSSLGGFAACALTAACAMITGCDGPGGTSTPPPPTPKNDAVIIVVPDDNHVKRLQNYVSNSYGDVRKQLQREEIGVNTAIVSLQDFSAGVIASARPLSVDEVNHDVDKIYGDLIGRASDRTELSTAVFTDAPASLHEWHRFTVGGSLLFPLTFMMPGLPTPIGLTLGGELNFKRTYSFTVKTAELLEDRRTVLGDAWDRVAGFVESVGAIRIPLSAEAIIRKYPMGTEIARNGVSGVLTRVGLNGGAVVASGSGDVFALFTSNFETRLKVLYDSQRQLVRYSIKNTKETGSGAEASFQVGVTIFQTEFLSGILSVNLLAARTMSTQDHTLIFDYTYDLGSEAARHALEAAVRGDLRPTQELAIFREDEDRYQGVIINAQKAIDVLTKANTHALGFSINNSALSASLGQIKLGEALGGFLYNGTTSSSHATDEEQTNFMHEKAKVHSLDYDANHREITLWGWLVNNERKLHASAQIVASQVTKEDGETREVEVPKVSYSYFFRNERNGSGVIREFLTSAVNVVGWSDPAMMSTIATVAESRKCEARGPAVLQLRGTLYAKALARIAAYDEATLWTSFGRMMGVSSPERFAERASREAYLKDLGGSVKERTRKLERDFLPRWTQLKLAEDDRGRMLAMHKLIENYKLDTTGFEFLLMLASQDRGAGSFGSISLKSPRCNFTWSQKGDLEFNLADVALDWN